jgi:hypothetical protein
MVKRGLLDKCKGGPLFWIDTADSQPCIGTGGIAAWQLTAHGGCRGLVMCGLVMRDGWDESRSCIGTGRTAAWQLTAHGAFGICL